MRHRLVLGAMVAVAAAAGLALLFWPKKMAEPPPPPMSGPSIDTPAIEHPLPPAPPEAAAASLPPLADSDAYTVEALAGVFGAQPVHDFLATPGVVRRIVATVDNLGREKLPLLTRAVGAIPGSLAVRRDGERIFISEANYARYTPYVQAIAQLDVAKLVALYRNLYPLLQQAYGEVGKPGHYFNDRVVAVIDDLLATPALTGNVELVQPSVYFRFRDPALEASPAGQKLLLRMGPANAAAVKDKLAALRALIATQ